MQSDPNPSAQMEPGSARKPDSQRLGWAGLSAGAGLIMAQETVASAPRER